MVRVVSLVAVLSVVGSVAVADEDPAGLRSELGQNRDLQTERRAELEEVREQAGDARQRLQDAEEALEEAREELEQRQEDLAAARVELRDAREQAKQARAQLRDAQDHLAETEFELAQKQEQLDARVRAAFKYGQVSFAEAFVGTRELADFLNSTTYVGHVMANDRDLIEVVVDLLAQVETQRSEAQAARVASEREAQRAEVAAREVEEATRDQRRLTDDVRQRRVAHAEALEELQQDAAAISEHLDDLGRSEDQVRTQIAEAEARIQARLESERLEREEAQRIALEEQEREQAAARAREEQAAAGDADSSAGPGADGPTTGGSGGGTGGATGGGSSGGTGGGSGGDAAGGGATPAPETSPAPDTSDGWLRPTSGRVSSGYGNRTHPVHGGQRLHSGVDLASPSGTPVQASRAGVVSFVGWMSGYGNTVMISHGDGTVTLYAHLSSYGVSRDASVQRGQSVGGVGSTGTATGPHLHFEVRVGGEPRNPCGYISC